MYFLTFIVKFQYFHSLYLAESLLSYELKTVIEQKKHYFDVTIQK